jgi:hypothetical protein
VKHSQAIDRWSSSTPSSFSDHEADCCRRAKAWFGAMDISRRPADRPFAPPQWLRERYEWGPIRWPLYWCNAAISDQLDCGALAFLAKELLSMRGIPALAVQLIQQFSQDAVRHWESTWNSKGISAYWVAEDLVYHEACAVLRHDETIAIWDPTDNCWISPNGLSGYASTIAIRIFDFSDYADPSKMLRWGIHRVKVNAWTEL